MSDLSLLRKLFECYSMLCRSESIIKEKDEVFKMHAEVCLCQGESSWVMGKKGRRDWLKLKSEIYLEVRLFFNFCCLTEMSHWMLERASCMGRVLIISCRT